VLYSVQETCTRKILYKKPCQTLKFLVQVDLYKFLVQVSWLCVTTISPLLLHVAIQWRLRCAACFSVKIKKLAQNLYEEEGVENIFEPTTQSSLSRNYRYLTLHYLTFGVGRLLHLPSAEAVSVRPNAQPRCNHKVTVIGGEAEKSPATWDWWRAVWLFLLCGLLLVSSSPSDFKSSGSSVHTGNLRVIFFIDFKHRLSPQTTLIDNIIANQSIIQKWPLTKMTK